MGITHEHVLKTLEIIRHRFRRILDAGAPDVLEQARQQIRDTWSDHDNRVRQRRSECPVKPWGYSIDADAPLRFVPCIVDGVRLSVDVMSTARWDVGGDEPCCLKLVARVWARERHVFYRDGLDSPAVLPRISVDRGRVMLRFHFDKATLGQRGPKYHLQLGGKPAPDEHCWLHPSISVPRLAYPPTDLVIACEMIAANFFPDEYTAIRSDPAWRGMLKSTQEYLLRPYHSKCLGVINAAGADSILNKLECDQWQ